MQHYVARGLPADWLNAWLAAIGITVLVPEARLGWTDDYVPKAVLSWPGDDDLPNLIATHLPSVDDLEQLTIAGLPQNIERDQYREAAARARQDHDLSLGVITTDLGTQPQKNTLPNGPFNVGAPRGETVFRRLRACRRALDNGASLGEQVTDVLNGRGRRVKLNGLGFDYRRIAAPVAGEADKLVDPVVECLCYHGLLLHPMGGDGTNQRQRGWFGSPRRRRGFVWPSWKPELDRWSIDALLDVIYGDTARMAATSGAPRTSLAPQLKLPAAWRRLGAAGLYGHVPFRQTGASDATRGYATERLA